MRMDYYRIQFLFCQISQSGVDKFSSWNSVY